MGYELALAKGRPRNTEVEPRRFRRTTFSTGYGRKGEPDMPDALRRYISRRTMQGCLFRASLCQADAL
jgi:hypothetical protein